MKNIGSKYLIALLGISLAGIIGLQIYLFNNSIKVKEAQFNRDAMIALQSISNRLEELDAMRFIDQEMEFKPWLSQQIEDEYSMDTVDAKGNVFSSKGNIIVSKDTFIVLGDGKTQARMQISSESGQFGQSEKVQLSFGDQGSADRIYNQMSKMDSVLYNMVNMSMKSAVPITERFTTQDIDSVIETELLQYDIKTKYEYAVVENGYITSLQSDDFKPTQADFRMPVFRNDFVTGPKWLMINFPKKANYVLRSMWYMVALSLVFMIAIVLTFWKTLRQMQKQKRISQIKTDFINNMTHEFKTPIATINLAVDALNNPKVVGDKTKLEHYSKVIRMENKRMFAQVENVLQLAMLEKNELELNKEPLDLNDLMRSAMSHLKLAVESKGGEIVENLSLEELTVFVDPVHLENVLVNLLDNANKYSPTAPVINVITYATTNHVVVEVKDSGIGMTAEVKRQIFERFYREERGNIHNVKGHGLGLSYAIKMVQLHNGTIDVESEPQQGSTFKIKLPKYEQ